MQIRRRVVHSIPTSRWLRQYGATDQLVEWERPSRKPDWMTDAEFLALPTTLQVRELRYRITLPGRRTRQVTLATTLLDALIYPAAELAELYQSRWQVELNFRHLKQTLKMDVLHCKTVDGVLKELLICCLLYNLVRQVMLESAERQDVRADRVSFIDALRWLKEDGPIADLARLVLVPLRPERFEPRVKKRRPKNYPLMQHSRQTLRNALRRQQLAS